MAKIVEDLLQHLTDNVEVRALVDLRVHAHHVPERSLYPFIWLSRSGRETDRDHDGQGGLTRHDYDIEAVSDDQAEAEDVADAVHDALAGHRGTFGARDVQGVFVEDQDDDYVPRGTGGDDGLLVVAQRVTIWST